MIFKINEVFVRRSLTLIFFFVFIMVFTCYADSLWNKNSSSPFSPDKAYKVGDIITILIVESTSAQQKAGTNTNIQDDLSMQLSHTIQRLAPYIGTDNSVTSKNANKYVGAGTTQRASSVTAKIAAIITNVFDNGNLKIEGKHKLDVNDESQQIEINGIVRSRDVSASNTIYSYQVASAEVSVRGSGAVQEAEAPGWFTRIINWLF